MTSSSSSGVPSSSTSSLVSTPGILPSVTSSTSSTSSVPPSSILSASSTQSTPASSVIFPSSPSSVTSTTSTPVTSNAQSSTTTSGQTQPTTASSSTLATTTHSSGSSVSSTHPASSAPVHPHTATLYGGGTVAGIAIGTAIAGALLAGLVIFLLMSAKLKKRQSRSGGFDEKNPGRSPLDNQGMPLNRVPSVKTPTTTTTLATRTDSIQLTDYLPQPPAEETLINDVSRLFTIVEGHADNHYHTMAIAEPVNVPNLLDLEDKRFHMATLRTHLANPGTRAIAIRRLILTMITAGISLPGNAKRSFLPKELVNLIGLMSINQDGSSASPIMFSQWRVLTASQIDLQQSMERPNHMKAVIAKMVADLNALLNPYILPGKRGIQENHLTEVMRRAARLGVSLFMVPAIWDFQWPADGRGFAVSPAFVKICDEKGRVLDPQMVGLKAEYVRV